ncbi:Uncharacterised protein [Bordetella pertussis]|nr:Uncharacterised protein [Bordetella pertussis]CPL47467.1 Uncharacterised protein [Bordetella pertussis]
MDSSKWCGTGQRRSLGAEDCMSFHMISLVYSSSAASGAVTERLTLRRRWPAG